MARALIIFASEDGQTAKIARRLGELLRERGVEAAMRDGSKPDAGAHLTAYDGVIVGSPIHFGHHAKPVRDLVKGHLAILRTRHTAFYSVSLSAGGPSRDAAAAKRYLEEFSADTGWTPDQAASFAGAVRNSRYGFIRALMVQFSLRKSGAPPPGDHEYTDWGAVTAFAESFAKRLASPEQKR
ncbi:MAG: protoporphyrinogen oxidase [Betaproteobacteria bacterium]|nr:protoporphyrinogen oxidase [Betaproteobacteria bacterium]